MGIMSSSIFHSKASTSMSHLRLARNIIPQIIFMDQVDFAMELYAGVMAPALNMSFERKSAHREPYRNRERKARRDHGIFLFRYNRKRIL